MDVKANELAQRVQIIFKELRSKESLTPTQDTSALFSSLVELILATDPVISREIVKSLEQDGILQPLIDICCKGEIELERYWARKILHEGADIHEFPYYKNYRTLTEHELQQLRKYIDLESKKMLFVGSGAMPITAIMFKEKEPSLEIRCIDRYVEFVQYARKVLLRLGVSDIYIGNHNINDLNASIISKISNSNIVFIAALVGNSNQQKNRILSNIYPYLSPTPIVAVRSVPEDMRRLMYPKFELEDILKAKYDVLGEYVLPRETQVINSLVILSTK